MTPAERAFRIAECPDCGHEIDVTAGWSTQASQHATGCSLAPTDVDPVSDEADEAMLDALTDIVLERIEARG